MQTPTAGYGWVARLQPAGTARSAASLSVVNRATEVIGRAAADWGIETGARMAAYILDSLTDWPGTRSDEERQILTRATEASTLDTLAALVSGDEEHLSASFEPIANVSSYVRNEIPLPEVIRNVHTGQEFLIEQLMAAIIDLVPEDDRVAAISRMTHDVTACWSSFIARIGVEYQRQQDEWLRSTEGRRTRLVQALVTHNDTDPGEASRQLGYDLLQTHVSCILWFDGLDQESLRLMDHTALGREAQGATGSSAHLLLGGSDRRFELWLGNPTRSVSAAIRQGRWPAALRAAVGTPQDGLEGFATTRAEARAAADVALRSESAPHVVDYADVELVSLLTSDFDRARTFVVRTLGPIARRDARSEELRATLAAWIDSSGSVAATSQALYMHRNTVSYRMRQLEELLGTDLDMTRVRCALTILEWMPQVLPTEDAGS